MCLRCEGWNGDEIREKNLRDIAEHGWSCVQVEPGAGVPGFAYSVGLTRFHGHPELLVSGLEPRQAVPLLDELCGQVRHGTCFHAGDVLDERCCEAHRLQFVPVSDPRRLVQAQEIYASPAGLVPALQVVYTDDHGCWPWEGAWLDGWWQQPLFGQPGSSDATG